MASPSCVKGASVVWSFIHIAKRGYSKTATHPIAPFEFLLPRSITRTDCHGAFTTSSFRHRRTTCPLMRKPGFGHSQRLQTRSFTATASRTATTCVLNPQTDDDGKEMMLEITPRAAKRLSEIMRKDNNPNLALRIQVESGGCHGFQYLMSLVTIPPKDVAEWSGTVNEDDTIFQFVPDGKESTTSPTRTGARVILDEPSLDLLKGSKVDFTMELIGSQFKIVDNPYATSSCGCGTSFDIKM